MQMSVLGDKQIAQTVFKRTICVHRILFEKKLLVFAFQMFDKQPYALQYVKDVNLNRLNLNPFGNRENL